MNSREGTSGIMLTENKDGSIMIQYVDYGVGFYGGSDYEVTYRLTAEATEKLKKHLNIQENETFEDSLIREFGENFSETTF